MDEENKPVPHKEESALLDILHSVGGVEINLSDIPQPFEREIFLYGTDVAGTNHIEDIEEIAKDLEIGEKVFLYREPENPHDERAIVIRDVEGRKLGYVPRTDNLIFSRLMDAGKELFGKIRVNELENNYRHIVVKIYMQD